MMAGGDVDGEGAARCRRQRRLRSWLKHERQSVAMALAEYSHHASRGQTRARAREEVEHVTHSGLRAQKTPPPGERPGLPLEPRPQRSDRTVRRSSGDNLPTLALPVLAGSAGEAVDARTLRFLLGRSLAERKEKEEVQSKAQVEEFRQASLARPRELYGSKRKRKKRRKRRTPRTSSCPLRGRRRQWQWHARNAGFFGDVPPRAVFPSVVVRPEMLGIMAVLFQKDNTTLVDHYGSGMCRVGFTCYDAPRVMFPSGVAKPGMLGILAGMDQKGRCSGMYKAGIYSDNAPRAAFPSGVAKPRMLCILAGMDQKGRCSGMYMAGIYGDNAPRAVFSSLVGRPRILVILAGMDQEDSCSGMYKSGIAGYSAPRAVFFLFAGP